MQEHLNEGTTRMHRDRRWGVYWAVAVALALIFLVFGLTGYPVPKTDGIVFVVPAISWARGDGFVNEAWPKANWFDATRQRRFVYHGPFYPWVLSRLLLGSPTGPAALLAIQALNAVALLFFAVLMRRLTARMEQGLTWRTLSFLVLCLFAFASVLLDGVGRPETVATLLILGGLFLLLFVRGGDVPRAWLAVALGCLLGLLGATQPIVAVEGACLLAAWYALRCGSTVGLAHLAGLLVVAAIVFLGFMTGPYPFPLRDWLSGLRRRIHHPRPRSMRPRGRRGTTRRGNPRSCYPRCTRTRSCGTGCFIRACLCGGWRY